MSTIRSILQATRRRWWVRWMLAWVGWTLIGLFFTVQSLLAYASQGYDLRYTATLIVQLSGWYAWGLLVPLMLHVARRFPLERSQRVRTLWMHLAALVVIAPLQVALALTLRTAALVGTGVLTSAQALEQAVQSPLRIAIGSFDAVATYVVLLGLYFAGTYYQKYRQRQEVATRLQAQLAQAQLHNLRMQLHPHFLFNTLHSISALVSEDPEAAERMIARLSEVLRITLERADVQEVTLRDELGYIERYLAIEQIRFPDRLQFSTEVEPETLSLLVPNLLLQPLVENAVRHAIAPNPHAGHLCIRAQRRDGRLQLAIVDDGPGVDGSPTERIGLGSTRERLLQRYGDAATLTLSNQPDGGLCVRIELPALESVHD